MSKLDVVIVDTYAQNLLPGLAIEQAVQTGLVRRVHTFSSQPLYAGEEFYRIKPIHTARDYSHIMLNVVPYCVDADATLVVQWDGMPCNRSVWTDDFLQYDYIGAPWGGCDPELAVGNGGFSLRSRRLANALVKLKISCNNQLAEGDAEDVLICRHNRATLQDMGCIFAPPDLACRFSVENEAVATSFGFHGVFNFPRLLPEQALLGTTQELCLRTSKDLFLINFLIACLNARYIDLYQETLVSLQAAQRFAAIQAILHRTATALPGF